MPVNDISEQERLKMSENRFWPGGLGGCLLLFHNSLVAVMIFKCIKVHHPQKTNKKKPVKVLLMVAMYS